MVTEFTLKRLPEGILLNVSSIEFLKSLLLIEEFTSPAFHAIVTPLKKSYSGVTSQLLRVYGLFTQSGQVFRVTPGTRSVRLFTTGLRT